MSDTKYSPEIERELLAERELEASLAASKGNLAPKCPECGGIGTLEEIDGKTVCIDCDEDVLRRTKIAGFGRR